jgi:hypothetical protein
MTPEQIAAKAIQIRGNLPVVIEPLRTDPEASAASVSLAIGGLTAAVDMLLTLVAELADEGSTDR